MRLPIYLDYMATTPVDPRVAAKMQQYLTVDGVFGNSASPHIYGYAAKEVIDDARAQVAALISASPSEIIWTSGATEANNLAIKGAANFYKRQGRHIITCKTEHKAVLDVCKYLEVHGFEVTYLQPEFDGLLDLNKLAEAIRDDTILVSIMHVNNEIGVIQNIAAIGALTRARGILFHVDAAQSVGKIPIDVKQMQIDLMSITAHKIYGPKGIGALYVRGEPKLHLDAQIHGGGQEHGLRSGTLPTHQIVGMGEALALAGKEMQHEQEKILALRNRFLQGLLELGGVDINGSLVRRIAGNLNFSFADIDGETLIAALKDLAISTGSACTTLSFEPSYVLRALGLKGARLHNALRFSFGRFTTDEEIDFALDCIKNAVRALR
jgi:cysteine desulfurase